MALLFMDGFDAGDTSVKWDNTTGTPSSSATTRFSTGRSLGLSSATNIAKNITASAQVTVGFAMFVGLGNNWDVRFYGDSGSTSHHTLSRNNTSGFLELRRGSGGTLLATGTIALTAGQWYYIEMQGTIADSGGTAIVRVNGSSTPDINFTGDTKNGGTNTTIDTVYMSGTTSLLIDDLYILNSTGSSNTTFLGDVRIHSIVPSGDGASSQLTGSDGNQVSNYQQVDELPYNTSDYNGSPTSGHSDTYVMGDLPVGVGTVYGLQNNMIAGKSDATAISARTVLRMSSTNYYGSTRVLSTSYFTYKDIYDTNPNTSVAWTVSDVNGLEAGMEVV